MCTYMHTYVHFLGGGRGWGLNTGHTEHSLYHRLHHRLQIYFIYLQYWGWNSGLRACWAGTLSNLSLSNSPRFILFFSCVALGFGTQGLHLEPLRQAFLCTEYFQARVSGTICQAWL
jgi:hypothetical protein